jgi:hypothetical protein
VLVERMIMPETFDPDECLTSASEPSACAVPVPLGTSPTDAFYIAAAAEDPALHTVDLNPAFCPGAPVCQPVVGGEIVWRDDHHVTAQYAVSRRDQVWKLLRAILRTLWVIIFVILVYAYLEYLLGLFPWTRALSIRLSGLVSDRLLTIGVAILDALPDLLLIAILIFITRYALKITRLF